MAPARAAAIVAGMRFSSVRAHPRQLGQRGVDGRLVALRAPAGDRLALLGLAGRVHDEDHSPAPSTAAVSGEGSVSVKRLRPTTTCSPASMRRMRSRWESTSAAFM